MTDETERLCPSCGNANPADAQFCRECGAILIRSRGGAKRSATGSEVGSSTPPPPGEIPLSPPRRRRGGLAATLVAILLLVASLIVYQRHRAGTLPVPGEPRADVTPAAVSPAEERPGAVAAKPTLPAPPPGVAPAGEEGGKPTANPPSEVAAAKPAIPPASHETAPASEEAPAKPARKIPAEPAVEPARRRHTGWYRVRYRTPLFQSPSETAPVVTHLAPGTRIHVTRVLPGFLAVESTTGKPPGYVSSDDVLPDSVAGTYP